CVCGVVSVSVLCVCVVCVCVVCVCVWCVCCVCVWVVSVSVCMWLCVYCGGSCEVRVDRWLSCCVVCVVCVVWCLCLCLCVCVCVCVCVLFTSIQLSFFFPRCIQKQSPQPHTHSIFFVFDQRH